MKEEQLYTPREVIKKAVDEGINLFGLLANLATAAGSNNSNTVDLMLNILDSVVEEDFTDESDFASFKILYSSIQVFCEVMKQGISEGKFDPMKLGEADMEEGVHFQSVDVNYNKDKLN